MSDIAVRVEHVGKQYHIGARQMAYRTLRDALADAAWGPLRRLRGVHSDPQNAFWALDDVSFEIRQGEAVGIIGRNGAGKSTLLKILSRITRPTRGRVELFGRVGSLLEVGTGFHPELTGRENIYLNGAILGMSRREIERKFDEIVAFSEIEKFLDTPVKFYSSGMYVRLAFAVAAHLEPEILVVDEVLAVGDAEFQRKCLGKMEDVSYQGRTVLFVSHNLSAIAALCKRALWLEKGALFMSGSAPDILHAYTSNLLPQVGSSGLQDIPHYGNGNARFTSIHISPIDADGNPASHFIPANGVLVGVRIKAVKKVTEANVALIVYDASGYRIIDVNTALKNRFISLTPGEETEIRFQLLDVLLKPDRYLVGLWMGRPDIEDIDGITYAGSFSMEVDSRTTQHSQIFPGVYQCRYQLQIGDEQC
jgi:lipopolysaccharide transport system ATP-binding protein